MKLSITIPCFNEESALPRFFTEISNVTDSLAKNYSLECELIFVDDGSKDGTLALLREAAKNDSRVKYISFSRNFGKESAIFAGLQRASGDFVAIMDADLQDPPELLAPMYEALKSGEFDSAATRRMNRKGEPPVRSFFARQFYRLINKFSDADIMDGARDFRMMSRKVTDAVLSMGEYNRFSKGIFGWVGFRTKWIPYENHPRVAGETKWSFRKLFKYALQGIMAFSTAPLSLASIMGLAFCALAFFMVAVVIAKTIIYGDPVVGWPSLACIILFIGGVQLFCIGILGQYLAKAYLEVKHRPVYIVAETEETRK